MDTFDYIYLCSIKGDEFLNYYQQCLNNEEIYVRVCISERDLHVLYVAPEYLEIAKDVIVSLPLTENLFLEKELEGTFCPLMPISEALVEQEARKKRNADYYTLPFPSEFEEEEEEENKKGKTFIIEVIMVILLFVLPLGLGLAVSVTAGNLSIYAAGGIVLAIAGFFLIQKLIKRNKKRRE